MTTSRLSTASPTVDDVIARLHAACTDFLNGDPTTLHALCSRAADATLFGGWGGYERGWAQLEPRYEWAAGRFVSGEIEFEELARHVSDDLACTVMLERSRVQLRGMPGPVAMTLRATHIFRREADGWRLMHRHADHSLAIEATDSVVDRQATAAVPAAGPAAGPAAISGAAGE